MLWRKSLTLAPAPAHLYNPGWSESTSLSLRAWLRTFYDWGVPTAARELWSAPTVLFFFLSCFHKNCVFSFKISNEKHIIKWKKKKKPIQITLAEDCGICGDHCKLQFDLIPFPYFSVRNSLRTFISISFGRENNEQDRVEVNSTFWAISWDPDSECLDSRG